MVNKKGYIKTLEAVVAIIIIVVISYTLIPQRIETQPIPPIPVQDSMRFINNKIELDETLRSGMIEGIRVDSEIADIIIENKPINYDFTCAICSDSRTCFVSTPLKRSVYVSDIFIASGGKKQNPKIVRVWFWEGCPEKDCQTLCGVYADETEWNVDDCKAYKNKCQQK